MSNVLTHHNDNSRTGANLQEVQLTTSNVNVNQFGKLFTRQVDGQIYAQPLYVSNVSIPNWGIRNIVYVATMHNVVYAFDADDPNLYLPLWKNILPVPVPLPDPNIGPSGYADILNEVGIISTPVISLQHNAIYVVSFTKVGSVYSHWLWALDLATGSDKIFPPVQIMGSVQGSGDGSVNGQITFTSNRQIQRSALLLANDIIYIAFASYGDQGPYHGWVFAYNATTLQQVAVYNTTPNGGQGGIWMAGQGPAADSANNVYFTTGNGSFNSDGSALGDSFVKLRPDLTLADWFSPNDNSTLNFWDWDVGSSGVLLIPGTNLLLGGGKVPKFYLLDTNNMGHFQNWSDSQIVQSFPVNSNLDPNIPPTHHIHGGPAYWNGPRTTT
jgi:hypothetical protein